MKVTFTPSQAQGSLLRVVVLTGAALTQPGGVKTADTTVQPYFDQPVPVQQAGSLVYGALYGALFQQFSAATGSVITGSELVAGSPGSALATFRSAAATTGPGTPSYGAREAASVTGAYAAAEILAAAGESLAEDPSAPPNVARLGPSPLVTADFTPPAGSLLVASAACTLSPGSALTAAMTSDGPAFTQAAWFAETHLGLPAGGAGVWLARV
jgi:hypothetical protein